MNYLIDKKVVFSPENNLLFRIDDPDATSELPRPAGLLFHSLLKNQGVLVSRDDLMNDAWINEGFRSSGHNLSTYLSVLRHALLAYDCSADLIKTIPKRGLILEGDVEFLILNTPTIPQNKPAVIPISGRLAKYFPNIIWITILLSFIFLFGLIAWLTKNALSVTYNQTSATQVIQFEKCRISFLKGSEALNTERLVKLVRNNKGNELCHQQNLDVFVAVKIDGVKYLSSVSFCRMQTDGNLGSCLTKFTEGKL